MSVPAPRLKYSAPMTAGCGAEVGQLAGLRARYVELHGNLFFGDAHDGMSVLIVGW